MKHTRALTGAKRRNTVVQPENEISKKTIFVILILTILISVFGTLGMLNAIQAKTEAMRARPTAQVQQSQTWINPGGAKVTLDIAPLVQGTGRVSVNIAK